MIVGVIGSGSIGPDLAYGFVSAIASKGGKVFLNDIRPEALEAGVARIQGYVGKAVARGKLSEKAGKAVLAALVPTLNAEDLAPCEYVLEAATEALPLKRKILANIERIVRPDCLIGFATSGIPRAEIAAEAVHPERCFVNHPFFPAWRSPPVEVVLSGHADFGARMLKTLETLGKVPIVTADAPCFAADDIFCNYVSEAGRLVEEGVASAAAVDAIVHEAIAGGGPLNVMDLTRGNLLTVHCQELMRDAPTGSPWFEAPALLSTVGNGLWHDPKKPGDKRHTPAQKAEVLDRILAVLFARTLFVWEQKICEAADLDWLTRMSLGFRDGLLSLAHEWGAEAVRDLCLRFEARFPGFHVPQCVREGRLPEFRRFVVTERGEDGVATVRIFRPEVKNALNRRTLIELDETIAELGADDAVKGIVLTSTGGGLAGADINELAALPNAQACEDICHFGHSVLRRIANLNKPVVVAVDGPVLGGGAELSMACHARVVGPGLVFGQPEVNLGIIPGYGGTQRLPRLVGLPLANELLRTARSLNAKEALAAGWATEIASDVLAAGRALIHKHLAGEVTLAPVNPAPLEGVSLGKVALGHRSLAIDAILTDVLLRGLSLSLDEGLRIEAAGFGRCKNTVDLDIGMKNFAQNGPRVPACFLHE
jgi:enoyl-CoA hydratase/3-hydroxyacyl-CoA dehydrogenase